MLDINEDQKDALIRIEGLSSAILNETKDRDIEVFVAFFHRKAPNETNKVGTNCSMAGMMGLIGGMIASLGLDQRSAEAVNTALTAGITKKIASASNGERSKIEVVKR